MDNELEKYKKAVLEKAEESDESKDEKSQTDSFESIENSGDEKQNSEQKKPEDKGSIEKDVSTENQTEEKNNDASSGNSMPPEENENKDSFPLMSKQVPLEPFDMENRISIKIHGIIYEGAMRGKQLIERHGNRLQHMLGYYPFPGTVNVKLDKKINMEDYETTRLQHHLLDGRVWIDARLAKAVLHKNGISQECWIIREETSVHEEEIVEIISKEELKTKLQLKEDDDVEVELYLKTRQSSYEKFKRFLHRFVPKSKRIMKG